jgi:penicillin-binding protein 2
LNDFLNNYEICPYWYKKRLAAIILIVVFAFSILIMRLFYLQIVEGEEYRRLSENNCIRLQRIEAARGLIFDRHGKLMVDNRPSFDLCITPKDAYPIENTIERLSSYLKIPVEELMTSIQSARTGSYQPIFLKRDIGRDALAVVEVHKFDLPGISVSVRPLRNYIYKNSAAHLLGYLGEINASELKSGKYAGAKGGDYIGKFGTEKVYEQHLRGVQGGRQVEVNATGKVVRVLHTLEAQPGHNLYLTIDQSLQRKAEALLEGHAGAVVAIVPDTGHILALASSPSFDQNAFVTGLTSQEWRKMLENPLRPMENKAIQAEYPPASIYKIVTALAGLEEGIIDRNTTFYCPGHYQYGNRTYRCWKKSGHGKMTVESALAQSCDVFFYQVGQKLGVDRLACYAKAFGLGEKTGIALDHEARGLIPTSSWKKKKFGVSWQSGETLSIAIGQGYNLVTPLQMATLIAAVANGGFRVQPVILQKIETAGGEVVYENMGKRLERLSIRQDNLEIVRRGLFEVVNQREGTAWGSRIKDLEFCGKTGTAQVFSRKGNTRRRGKTPKHLQPHAWFVAYAPAENPAIAVSVIVEHGEHGSSIAAPIAGQLIEHFLAE